MLLKTEEFVMHKVIMAFVVCLALHSAAYSCAQSPAVEQRQEVRVQEKSNLTKLIRALAKTGHEHPIMVAWMLFDCYEHRKEGTFPGFASALCGIIMARDLIHNMLHEYGVEHDCSHKTGCL
jgi:hypothetical protein